MSQANRHLSPHHEHTQTLNVMVGVVQEQQIGLEQITLPSHRSHALQPLDVSCCKPLYSFSTMCRNMWSHTKKGKGGQKEDLARQSIEEGSNEEQSLEEFKSNGICSLNYMATMDNNMQPSAEGKMMWEVKRQSGGGP